MKSMPKAQFVHLQLNVFSWIALLVLFMAYPVQAQDKQAAIIATQALELAEQSLGADHPSVATNLINLAVLYQAQGQYAQAEPLYKRALAIYEKSLGAEHPSVATSLGNLATLYKDQGQYAQAELLNKRALAIYEKSLGAEHPSVATSLNNLALLYKNQGQYAQAEPLYKRALAIDEKSLGAEHPSVATSLNNLASLLQAQGQYALAEPLYKRSLAIKEKTLGADHPSVANGLGNLATLYKDQGRYAQAEPLYKRALAIFEKSLGAEHPSVATSLSNLAMLYRDQGQYALAESLLKRALVIGETSLGADHPSVATILNNLALLYKDQGQYALAEPLDKRALAIFEKSLGTGHPSVARSLSNLAVVYQVQGKYAQAEPLFKRSLVIRETSLGADHPDVAVTLINLASLYQAQGQYAQAESLFKRALAINEKSLGAGHFEVARSLNYLAALYQIKGQYAQALPLSRRASAVYRQRIISASIDDAASREAASGQNVLFRHLGLLKRNPDNEPAAKIADEALQIVQLAQSSDTASAIAKMASRFASGSDALAVLAKRKQDAAERRSKGEVQLVKASSTPPEKREAASEQRLREMMTQTANELESIDAELTRRFPQYQELTRPEPVMVSKIQSLLKPGEAMLVYALGEGSYVWVVTTENASFRALTVVGKDVGTQVAKVRSQMETDDAGQLPKVSVDVLHDLYNDLFAPILREFTNITHVIVVPAGPLQSLPFGMLVATSPPEIKTDADYRQVDWLAKHYAFSVLPSVSSIQAFRQFAKSGQAQEPFVGFGDPVIGSGNRSVRGMRSKLDVAGVFRTLTSGNASGATGAQGAEIADVEAIRGAPRLPETAEELRNMAKALKASAQSVWLQAKATETQVKTIDLSKYRTLAFATHGVMAGELKGIGEPGLILTPPKVGSVDDDGYLSASEIAKLNLNADWVVLSACNTAAADGTPGAEGLSGMAKAFFYAGARSLLVSHWPVASEATVPLTTIMLKEYKTNPTLGKSQAQRKAILALMNTPDHSEYAHPLFWAPFVVVGEGG